MERSHEEPDGDARADGAPEAEPPDRATRHAAARAALRGIATAGSEPDRHGSAVLPFGVGPVDAHLPGGGLRLGRAHEIAPMAEGDEPCALGFGLALLARRLDRAAGEALLVVAPGHPTPYGHGLAGLGLDPGRVLLLEAGSDAEVYLALEEALRAGSLPALAGFVGDGLSLKQGRRLQLAAEAAGPLLLILRPARAEAPNGAATRWRIAAGGAARDRFGCLAGPRWRAHLDRCRNGRPGTWLLEWDHAAHRFGLPDALAGHPPAARLAGA
ncbi:ImuA family protein [Methylobacterium durans]|uniref:ImuA family protein n=1 Tax=Methylobacterium durans TaxID=2202825 RepID=UPI001F306D2F|nr:ImuA protein [Methylobacterium durans]